MTSTPDDIKKTGTDKTAVYLRKLRQSNNTALRIITVSFSGKDKIWMIRYYDCHLCAHVTTSDIGFKMSHRGQNVNFVTIFATKTVFCLVLVV